MDCVNHSPFGKFATVALFFHKFESIHPFEDENDRTGCVLFQVLLKWLWLCNCGL